MPGFMRPVVCASTVCDKSHTTGFIHLSVPVWAFRHYFCANLPHCHCPPTHTHPTCRLLPGSPPSLLSAPPRRKFQCRLSPPGNRRETPARESSGKPEGEMGFPREIVHPPVVGPLPVASPSSLPGPPRSRPHIAPPPPPRRCTTCQPTRMTRRARACHWHCRGSSSMYGGLLCGGRPRFSDGAQWIMRQAMALHAFLILQPVWGRYFLFPAIQMCVNCPPLHTHTSIYSCSTTRRPPPPRT